MTNEELGSAAPLAPRGCDDCSVEPGERHRYMACPGAERSREYERLKEDLAAIATIVQAAKDDGGEDLAEAMQAISDRIGLS